MKSDTPELVKCPRCSHSHYQAACCLCGRQKVIPAEHAAIYTLIRMGCLSDLQAAVRVYHMHREMIHPAWVKIVQGWSER